MAEYRLTGPLTDEAVEQLNLGDVVYISGDAFTCRSRLQKYIFDEGHALPFSTAGRNILIHNGPIIIRENGAWKLAMWCKCTRTVLVSKIGKNGISLYYFKRRNNK